MIQFQTSLVGASCRLISSGADAVYDWTIVAIWLEPPTSASIHHIPICLVAHDETGELQTFKVNSLELIPKFGV